MSRHGDITMPWGDGEYTFRLAKLQWQKLDERCKVGPEELLRRLLNGEWRFAELVEIHRLGLEGGRSVLTTAGAIDTARINRLVRDYVEEELYFLGRKSRDNPNVVNSEFGSKMSAIAIVDAACIGPADDAPKSKADASTLPSFPTEGSRSPQSTDGDQSSESPLASSTIYPFGNSTARLPAG
jgi:hypothetical protein